MNAGLFKMLPINYLFTNHMYLCAGFGIKYPTIVDMP